MKEQGLIVARFRRHVSVQDRNEKRYMCQIQRRNLRPVVGDKVAWQRTSNKSGTVTNILPRDVELTRLNARGNAEVIAANLSQLVIVLASKPNPDWFALDRYLCATELIHAKGLILLNKTDLILEPPAVLHEYETIGYPVHQVSAKKNMGLQSLAHEMANDCSMIVGQSGVGKSSLLNMLLGDTHQAVGRLSEKTAQGRHTTTTSVMYQLPKGGQLIDSPGIRDYTPYIEKPGLIELGFREFSAHKGNCRFRNCVHQTEPNCAIKQAVSEKVISKRRYESYKKLYRLTEKIIKKHRD